MKVELVAVVGVVIEELIYDFLFLRLLGKRKKTVMKKTVKKKTVMKKLSEQSKDDKICVYMNLSS